MKLNMKTVAMLGLGGAALLLLFPSVSAWALPLLFLAACPLAMVFMMKSMGGMSAGGGRAGASKTATGGADAAPPAPGEEATRLRAELDQLQAEKATLEATKGDGPGRAPTDRP